MIGGPGWIDADRFDVVGKTAESAPQPLMLLMLRSLLADRFKLRLHFASRESPIYALVTARNDRRLGPRLRPVTDCTPESQGRENGPLPTAAMCGGRSAPGHVEFGGLPLAMPSREARWRESTAGDRRSHRACWSIRGFSGLDAEANWPRPMQISQIPSQHRRPRKAHRSLQRSKNNSVSNSCPAQVRWRRSSSTGLSTRTRIDAKLVDSFGESESIRIGARYLLSHS